MLHTALLGMACVLALPPAPQADTEAGFVSIFDGRTLDGWDGNPAFWRVEEGAITGQTTAENPTKGNTFLIWRGGHVDNFELRLEYKLVGGNSGIQYRSFEVPGQPWVVGGYQGDFEAGKRFSGILYGEKFRGILANRGDKTEVTRDGGKVKVKVVRKVGDSDKIQAAIRPEQWNSYRIVADGYTFRHYINDVQTIECTDNDKQMRRPVGILALQLHAGPAMQVQFRRIRVKRLPAQKKVVLIAGKPSHGYGAHEHKAGCMLLAEKLNASGLPIQATVVTGGWPEDDSVLDDADAIVIYADGGGRHPFNPHLGRVRQLASRGIGIVALHYGVEVPKGEPGNAFLDLIGGYFETDWSVNPHWVANFKSLPTHPITNGVQPFGILDEWYYHMRFREGVVPILSDLPPESTLKRKDGPHSGNPAVRKAVADGVPQHVAWAWQRSDAGRGFGFTGGHFHWNWGHDQFRKVVLNAITWSAHADVPADGIHSPTPTVEELQKNQDYDPPDNFNAERIRMMLREWNHAKATAQ